MLNIEQLKKNGKTFFEISYIDKKSNLQILKIPVPEEDMFEWRKCSETDKNKDPINKYFLDSSPVKKVKAKRLNKYRTIEFLEDLKDETKELIYNNAKPRIFFCDIENGRDPITGSWSKPTNPTGEITAISLVDSHSTKVYQLGLKKLTLEEQAQLSIDINEHFSNLDGFKKDIEVKYFYFENESALLYSFWTQFVKKIYFLTGWNFTYYDWPYLINRSKKLLMDPFALMGARELYTGTPLHKVIIDYLDLYKKFDFKIIKESYTLDYTSAQVLEGIKKVSYSGTLDTLYENNPYRYMLYNTIDSYLVKLINEKLDLISLYTSIGDSTRAELFTVLKTITPVESIITRYYYKENLVLIPKKFSDTQKLAYEGGYVFEPEPALCKWVLAMDFASLYPSVQRQFNISPETYKGIDFERELKNGEIRLSNGAIFDNSKDSIFRKYLKDFYYNRKKSKNKQLKIDEEIAKLKKLLKTNN